MDNPGALGTVMSLCYVVGGFAALAVVWGAFQGDAFRQLVPFLAVGVVGLGAGALIERYGRRRWGHRRWWIT